MPSFDSIVHVTPDGRWFNTQFDAGIDRLLSELDDSDTEAAVVVGIAPAIPNDFILETCAAHSDRLYPCGGFAPATYRTPEEAVAAFTAGFADTGFRAVKFHPRIGGFTLEDERFLAVLSEMSTWRTKIPIWIDTLLYNVKTPLPTDPVTGLQRLALNHPELKFVFLHSTGARALQLFEAVRHLENAFLDLSYTASFYRESSVFQDLKFLCSVFDRRLVWGSDFPEVSLHTAHTIANELLDGLPPIKRQNVMGATLARILEE